MVSGMTAKALHMTLAFDIVLSGLVLGGMYALIALGLTLQYGIARIMNLSYGECLVAAAFAALYLYSGDRNGNERDSDGFLAQVTYKFGDTKVGVNYGVSNLDLASGEAPSNLVEKNEKLTFGVYHSLTDNLTLLAEFTDTKAAANDGTENDSSNFNVGAFLSF